MMDPFNSTILDDNLKELQERLGHSPDIVIRRIKSTTTQVEVGAVYIEGLIEKLMVNEFVEHAMSFDKLSEENPVVTSAEDIFLYMKEVARGIGEEQTLEDWDVLFEALFSGDTILWVNGIELTIRGIQAAVRLERYRTLQLK